MAIKMIVTDLDRTLLRTDKTISEFTETILKRCIEQGIKVVFATARPKNRVDILPIIHLADAIITDNGSSVYIENKIEYSFGIPAKTAKPFLNKLVETIPDKRFSIEYPHMKIANYDKSDLWLAEIKNDIANPLDIPATKMVVNAGAEAYDELCALLPSDLYAQLCEGRIILIMHQSATKWNAIQTVSNHFGVSIDETVAFGDDYNDILMLKNCGIGIAVANALDEVKAVANSFCDTNDNDGVARWLAANVL